MRRFLVALSAAALVALGMTSIVSAGGDPFTKTWSANDVDGSVLMLSFTGSGDIRTVTEVDSRALICDGNAFAASGPGTIDGLAISVAFSGDCVAGGPSPRDFTTVFTYQPASDTLFDGTLTFHRGNGARDGFLGVWKATDTDGSALKLTFRGSGLERDVTFLDNLAGSCDPAAPAAAAGTGLIGPTDAPAPRGSFIRVSLEGGCVGGAALTFFPQLYRYDVATDTIRGPLGLDGGEINGTFDWHRG